MKKTLVTVIIPEYKPDKKLLGKLKSHLKSKKNKKDRIKIFSEAHRILKNKGKFIISTPNYSRLSTLLRSFFWKKRTYPYAVAGGKGVPYTDWHYFEYSKKTIQEDLMKAGFKKMYTYSRFVQIPYFQNFFNVNSKYGLVLFTVAEK
jgi:ubiquinone/menaquinone biosynthesis C-methylase UbiE